MTPHEHPSRPVTGSLTALVCTVVVALSAWAGACGDDGSGRPATHDAGTDVSGVDTRDLSSNDPCLPNPCSAPFKTRCEVSDGNPVCLCEPGYVPSGEACVLATSCAGVTCQDHATCVLRDGTAACECDSAFHVSGTSCCGAHASEVSGACECDAGYTDDGSGSCVPTPDNPCGSAPCTSEAPHRQRCVVDATATDGYRCACNVGYEDLGETCEVPVGACTAPAECRAGYCAEVGLAGTQCVTDGDCPGVGVTCNAAAAGGICLGCGADLDCPGSATCGAFAACAVPCSTDADCPLGRCYVSEGVCGQRQCGSDQDCASGTRCVDEDGDGTGLCQRSRCLEVACSPTHPTGACSDGGTCLYGACVAGCTPNPCTEEPNKTECTGSGSSVSCGCAAGFQLDLEGRCQPVAGGCAGGMTCEAGRCTDRSDPGFVCATDSDCGSGLTCTPTLPSGQCNGCSAGATCPTGTTCLAGYCLRACGTSADCAANMACTNGYCGRKSCSSAADCPGGYACITGSGGQGTCNRTPCP